MPNIKKRKWKIQNNGICWQNKYIEKTNEKLVFLIIDNQNKMEVVAYGEGYNNKYKNECNHNWGI